MSGICVLFWVLYPVLLLLSLFLVQDKLEGLSNHDKKVLKTQIRYCRVLAFVPLINLFVFLWVVTEGLEVYKGRSL